MAAIPHLQTSQCAVQQAEIGQKLTLDLCLRASNETKKRPLKCGRFKIEKLVAA